MSQRVDNERAAKAYLSLREKHSWCKFRVLAREGVLYVTVSRSKWVWVPKWIFKSWIARGLGLCQVKVER